MRILINELMQSLRVFWRSPGFVLVTVGALTAGIAANTAIFSVVNTVLLKPYAIPDADRVVQFMLRRPSGVSPDGSIQRFFLWRRRTASFEDISAYRLELLNLTNYSDPQQVPGARVSADFFRLFGAKVLYGRTFTTEEDKPGGGRVAVLSYGFWSEHFGQSADITDKNVFLNGDGYRVVGVLAPGFDSEQFDQPPAVWAPFQIDPESADGGCYCRVTGRLKPGVTLDMANAELRVAAEEYRRGFPKQMARGTTVAVEPLRDAIVGDVRPTLMVLLGAVGFVLLIACTNVASLLLVRATGRSREMAIRVAIGAGRGRIVRQLITESLVLSFTGGVLGLILGLGAVRMLFILYPTNPLFASSNLIHLPRIGQQASGVSLDWRVLAFTLGVSLVTGVLFGLAPAIPASRIDLNRTLKESGGRSTGLHLNRSQAVLVISQIALALVLLVGASLLIRTVVALRNVDPGFDPRSVLVMQMSLAGPHFERTADIDALVRTGVEQIHSIPGVLRAAASCCIPLETVWQLSFAVKGRSMNGPYHGFAGWTFISPEYFDAFRIPILRGRGFTTGDGAGAPGVVVINQTMAHQFWPDSDPLNQLLIIGRAVRPEYAKDPARQIVGIVADARNLGLDRQPRPEMYVPLAQLPDGVNALNLRLLPLAWIVRTAVEPRTIATPIKERLQAGTGLPVARVRTMDEVAAQSTARAQLNMVLMTTFGLTALLLAAIGIYSVMAYSVEQRIREIGIRFALGASAINVRNMIIRRGLRLTLAGIAVGFAASIALSRFIHSSLFGVKASDPTVLAVVPLTLAGVSLLSVWLPANRAMRIDPIDALRHE